MKFSVYLIIAAIVVWEPFCIGQGLAAETAPGQVYEYVTIRWAGRDNTHLIRPGANVEFIGPQLRKVVRPDRVDERSFYMNVAMNGLAKEGYEFAGMTNDEIVMKRAVAKQ